MAGKLFKFMPETLLIRNQHGSVRYGHHLRGKAPGVARTLEQRLCELNYKDPTLHYRVDIGFAKPLVSRSEQLHERIKYLKTLKQNPDIEKQARNKSLKINLEDVKTEWLRTGGPYQIRKIANHYGVYQHLFGDAFFTPRIVVDVKYNISEEYSVPVFYGNVIKPSEAKTKPEVSFAAEPNTLWTLILTNPDGHLNNNNAEYVHWFVGNIPGGNFSQGETIIEYLQPFAPRGTGYHRFIFLLYKQNKKINYSELKKEGQCLNLKERTFSTLNFYRPRQDDITPAGLAFFQSDWDSSLTGFYHNTLNMKEPIYEYDFPPPYIRPQEWFPLRKPFNLYMDKYRDPKKINEEYLLKKLRKMHPFKKLEPSLPYPNAESLDQNIPSWLKTEIKKERLGWGRINDV